MNRQTKLVLELLKPKAESLGFNKAELEGAAKSIADNLGLEDDVTDEVLKEAVTKAVDAYFPLLELSQKNANRIITKNKEEREKAEAEARKKAEEERLAKEEAERKKAEEEAARKRAAEGGYEKFIDSDFAKQLTASNQELTEKLKKQEAATKKAQEEFNAFRNEFNALKEEREKARREKILTETVQGTGVFGERIKKNFAKMSFATDEEFDNFINGVKDDISAFNQERADKGLEKLGTPGKGEDKGGKVEPMSDAEIDALAAIM